MDLLPEEADVAALQRVEAEDRAGEGGLAAARLAHEAKAFALIQFEGHAVDGDDGRATAKAHPPAGIGSASPFLPRQEPVGARGCGRASGSWAEAARSARV
jgi:hypothetical protein